MIKDLPTRPFKRNKLLDSLQLRQNPTMLFMYELAKYNNNDYDDRLITKDRWVAASSLAIIQNFV